VQSTSACHDAHSRHSMAAEGGGIVVIRLVRRDSLDEELQFRVRATTPMSRLVSSYAFNCNVSAESLRLTTESGKALSPSDTPSSIGLEDGALVYVEMAKFVPFKPSHAEHSDLSFEVEGHTFAVHKFPVLKSSSPFLQSVIEDSEGEAVPLIVPGGAQVFDTVVRFLYKDEVNSSRLITAGNVAEIRVAASFLQMSGLAKAADDFLEASVLPSRDLALRVLMTAFSIPAAEAPENNVVQRCAQGVGHGVQWKRLAALASDVPAHATAKAARPWEWPLLGLPPLKTLLTTETGSSEALHPPTGGAPSLAAIAKLTGEGGVAEALLLQLPPRVFVESAKAARARAISSVKESEKDASGSKGSAVSTAGAAIRKADAHRATLRSVSAAAATYVLYRIAAAAAMDAANLSSGARDAEEVLSKLQELFSIPASLRWPDEDAYPPQALPSPKADASNPIVQRVKAFAQCEEIVKLVDPRAIPLALMLRIHRLAAPVARMPVEDSNTAKQAATNVRHLCSSVLAAQSVTTASLDRGVLSALDPEIVAHILEQSSASAPTRRKILTRYLSSRCGIPFEGDDDDGVDEGEGLSPDQLAQVLRAGQPHFASRSQGQEDTGVEDRADDDDDLDGDGGVRFYSLAFAALVKALRHPDSSEMGASAEDLMRSLHKQGALRLDLLPPMRLREALHDASVPPAPIAEAAVAQSEALAMQLAATQAQLQRTVELLRQVKSQAGLCQHNHLPIMTKVQVLRSHGSWQTGTVQAFSAVSGVYAVDFEGVGGGAGERRWYDLQRTPYRVLDDDDGGASPHGVAAAKPSGLKSEPVVARDPSRGVPIDGVGALLSGPSSAREPMPEDPVSARIESNTMTPRRVPSDEEDAVGREVAKTASTAQLERLERLQRRQQHRLQGRNDWHRDQTREISLLRQQAQEAAEEAEREAHLLFEHRSLEDSDRPLREAARSAMRAVGDSRRRPHE
jgi:hypothetical protein